MAYKAEVDIQHFRGMMTALAKVADVELKDVVLHEVGKALSQATAWTKVANRGDITKKFTMKSSVASYKEFEKDPTTYVTSDMDDNFDLVPTLRIGSKKYKLPLDITSKNFSMLKKELAKKRKKKLGHVGLAQASLYQTAKAIGASKHYKPTGNAKKAMSANEGLLKSFVSVKEKKAPFELSFRISCISLIKGTKGIDTVMRALKGREQYMEKNFEKGVFNSAKGLGRKYGFAVSK